MAAGVGWRAARRPVPSRIRAGILKVRLLRQSGNCLDEALKPLLAELDKARTV